MGMHFDRPGKTTVSYIYRVEWYMEKRKWENVGKMHPVL